MTGGARSGFFERDAFLAVRSRLPDDLQVAVNIACTYGWRMQSEVLMLSRSQLNLDARRLMLEPGTTENGEGREMYLTPEIKSVLAGQLVRVDTLQRQVGRIVPYLFPHLGGHHRGERRQDFRKAWVTACTRSGLSEMLRHDFRRTGVRNMVNAGVPERVAMAVTGHNTRSVFDRYHIVSPGDLQDVARRLTGTCSGTVAPETIDARLTRVP